MIAKLYHGQKHCDPEELLPSYLQSQIAFRSSLMDGFFTRFFYKGCEKDHLLETLASCLLEPLQPWQTRAAVPVLLPQTFGSCVMLDQAGQHNGLWVLCRRQTGIRHHCCKASYLRSVYPGCPGHTTDRQVCWAAGGGDNGIHYPFAANTLRFVVTTPTGRLVTVGLAVCTRAALT